MSCRIRVTLKRIPGKRKKAIQLSLAAGFKTIDSLTGDVTYKYLKVLIGESILESNWDRIELRPSQEYSEKDRYKLHHIIDRRVSQLEKAYCNLWESGLKEIIAPADVREEYLRIIGVKRKVQIQSKVADFISHYTQHSRKEKALTKNHYRLLEKRVREYEEETKKCLYWQSFNAPDYEDFIRWLQDSYSLSANSVWNLEKNLAKFRNLARQHGLVKTDSQWVRQANYRRQDKLYLTWEMIRAVMEYQPRTATLKNTRRIFLLLTFTGIRYSDLFVFLRSYEDDHPFPHAQFNLNKYPSPKVIIPCLEPVREIMNSNPPSHVSASHFHAQVKVLMTKIFGYATAKQISAHTCRRTFVSLFLQHVPSNVLSLITGHTLNTSRSVFYTYNHIDLKSNALLFVRHVRNIPVEQTAGIRLARFSEEVSMN